MEEKIKKEHTLCLKNREGLNLSGVTDVDSFNEETIIAYTDYGSLTVSGNELHVDELDTESGKMKVSGEVVALVYSSKTKKRKGFLSRIFDA